MLNEHSVLHATNNNGLNIFYSTRIFTTYNYVLLLNILCINSFGVGSR